MRRLVVGILIVIGLGLGYSAPAAAQETGAPSSEPPELVSISELAKPTPPEFFRGVVRVIESEETSLPGGYAETVQVVNIELESGERVSAEYVLPLGAGPDRLLRVDQSVVVARLSQGEDTFYQVTDWYRLPRLAPILILFLVVIVILAGKRGVMALAGLGVSIWLLLYQVVPNIARGADPLLTSLIAAFFIAIVSLYLAHGWSKRTTLAVVSTLITLTLAVIAATQFTNLTYLFGLGSEEGLELQYGGLGYLNLKGLLIAGMIIGALGVLDDITTAQAAAIEEIHKANPKLTWTDLYQRGMSVGREHITSLINTLALAYAGASLPMLLLFTMYHQPLWVTLNSEFVVEEVVRTLVGSLALTLAVPITSLLTSWYLAKKPAKASLRSVP